VTGQELDNIKKILREESCPFFSDDELLFYYEKNKKNMEKTIYECLIVKSEDTTLSVSGLNCSDTSKYFLRLASHYKPNNGGILGG
jgi:hypothetical protein